MENLRLVARLDIKAPYLIKGVHLEGVRKLGLPNEFATRYYQEGIDELLYMDVVASLYQRNNLYELVEEAVKSVFVPITVGGGIRSLEDIHKLLSSGADRIAINTAAVENPELLREAVRRFGSQCIVLSIEAKKVGENKWEAFTDNGRNHTGLDVLEWVKKGQDLGVGEIVLTSIDKEGTGLGFDIDLTKTVYESVSIPVVASGGMGKPQHLKELVEKTDISAIAMANILHYKKHSVAEIHAFAEELCLPVRSYDGRVLKNGC